MATETGARDKYCKVEIPYYETEDETAGGAPRWDILAYGWFRVETLREFELARNRAVQDMSTHRFTVDFDPKLANVSEARIILEGRTFKVLGVVDPDEAHEELVYLCQEEKQRPMQ